MSHNKRYKHLAPKHLREELRENEQRDSRQRETTTSSDEERKERARRIEMYTSDYEHDGKVHHLPRLDERTGRPVRQARD